MKNKRYPMGSDQPAQIDCRITTCRYYVGSGKCVNIAPAITLNENGTFVCWSRKDLKKRNRMHSVESNTGFILIFK